MKKLVISDASCLIVLAKINHLDLLKNNYGEIIVTPEIANEFGKGLPDWILIRATSKTSLKSLLEESIDLGESSAIALAYEIGDCTIILDDLKARKIAASMNLDITGTLGVIAKAKQNGVIPAVKPVFDLILKTDFRVSEKLIQRILKQLGEL